MPLLKPINATFSAWEGALSEHCPDFFSGFEPDITRKLKELSFLPHGGFFAFLPSSFYTNPSQAQTVQWAQDYYNATFPNLAPQTSSNSQPLTIGEHVIGILQGLYALTPPIAKSG